MGSVWPLAASLALSIIDLILDTSQSFTRGERFELKLLRPDIPS